MVDLRDRLEIAQDFYQRWLKSKGILDPSAEIQTHPYLGYVGVVGIPRAKITEKAYDVLPSDIIVEINRATNGLSPLDEALVRRLMGNVD